MIDNVSLLPVADAACFISCVERLGVSGVEPCHLTSRLFYIVLHCAWQNIHTSGGKVKHEQSEPAGPSYSKHGAYTSYLGQICSMVHFAVVGRRGLWGILASSVKYHRIAHQYPEVHFTGFSCTTTVLLFNSTTKGKNGGQCQEIRAP